MTPFDNKVYKDSQKREILRRIERFDKLYIEVGGKLFDDNHAARVLPGFKPDVKMEIFRELKSELQVILCVNAGDLVTGKERGDNGLDYGKEALRLAKLMTTEKIEIAGFMITFYESSKNVLRFEEECKAAGIKTYHSYFIEGYPEDLNRILSSDGFGKNDYIPTTKKLVLVTAPGANSGKMETCLSQIFHDKSCGISSGYAKYETFPVWNLPLDHLVNIAYEMATVDIKDKNMIDPYYLKSHNGEIAVNYNRDIEAFPILSKMLLSIMGESVYDSPTSMGINCVADAIKNDTLVQVAAYEEILRRHEKHKAMFAAKKLSSASLEISEKLLKKAQKIFESLSKN